MIKNYALIILGEEKMNKYLIPVILLLSLIVVSCGKNTDSSSANNKEPERLAKVQELNSFAKENSLKAKFGTDPNDSTTLIFLRESSLSAKDLHFNVIGYGTSIEDLKEVGFNKVRVYTSKDGYKKYHLVIL